MMSHVEVLLALEAAFPDHEMLPAVLALFQAHAATALRTQANDGRWHQLIDNATTFLETSVTAMYTFGLATGVERGWLAPRNTYAAAAKRAWSALEQTVLANGTITGICDGTGIGTTPEYYEERPREYLLSVNGGLGAVLRAAAAMTRMTQSLRLATAHQNT